MPLNYLRELLNDIGLLVDEQGLLIEGQGLPHNYLGLIWLRYIVLPTGLNTVVFYHMLQHISICLMHVYWLSTFCFIAFSSKMHGHEHDNTSTMTECIDTQQSLNEYT